MEPHVTRAHRFPAQVTTITEAKPSHCPCSSSAYSTYTIIRATTTTTTTYLSYQHVRPPPTPHKHSLHCTPPAPTVPPAAARRPSPVHKSISPSRIPMHDYNHYPPITYLPGPTPSRPQPQPPAALFFQRASCSQQQHRKFSPRKQGYHPPSAGEAMRGPYARPDSDTGDGKER